MGRVLLDCNNTEVHDIHPTRLAKHVTSCDFSAESGVSACDTNTCYSTWVYRMHVANHAAETEEAWGQG